MTDKYERRVARLFSNRFGLDLRKIPETHDRTPDFDVFATGERIAVLEVKGIESTAPIVTTEELARDEFIPEAMRRDNCAGRVATKIHEAVGQFEKAEVPKVLVLFNDGSEADSVDLMEALVGHLETEDGETFSTLPSAARRRMLGDWSKIDLYIWLDEAVGDEECRLVTTGAVGRALKSRYFLPAKPGTAG